MQKLKIGLVFDDSLDKPDGVQQYILSIGEWFRAQGHDVHYLVGDTKRRDIQNIHSLSRNLNVRFNHNRMSMPLPTSRNALRQLLKNERFDVLHVQMPYSPWLAHRIIEAADDKTVVFGTFHIVAHSPVVRNATRLLALWMTKSRHRFDGVVSVSSAAAEYARATFGVESQVLPNVVDYSRFSEAQPLEEYWDDVLTILFLGRLVTRKGCLQLLKAIVRLRQEHHDLPKFRVLICGRGPLESQLKEYVNNHQLTSLVTFVGFVDETVKPRYYATADIAVFPSTGGESFGIVLIEALAGGNAAVLAGNNSGYATVLSPHPDLLFDPHDVDALSKLLRRYMHDSSLRRTVAEWGKAYAKQFDTSIVGKQLLKCYSEALRKRRQQ